MLEPKNRQVDANMLMESMFHATDLQTRFSINMNVLTAAGVPQVMNLREVLQAFLTHRDDVVQRRSKHRLEKIAHRLEILGGLLIAYLNIDEVIRIIRTEDEPKPKIDEKMESDGRAGRGRYSTCACAVCANLKKSRSSARPPNSRPSRNCSRDLLKSEELRWKAISDEIKQIKKAFGESTALGKRRTSFTDAPAATVISIEAFVEKEPVTVLCSQMGWLRALKGHTTDLSDVKYKEGDEGAFLHPRPDDRQDPRICHGRPLLYHPV